jgi:hypothetical protein
MKHTAEITIEAETEEELEKAIAFFDDAITNARHVIGEHDSVIWEDTTPVNFNHLFSVAFSIVTEVYDHNKIKAQDLLEFMENRIRELAKLPDSEILEAFEYIESHKE